MHKVIEHLEMGLSDLKAKRKEAEENRREEIQKRDLSKIESIDNQINTLRSINDEINAVRIALSALYSRLSA